MEETYPERVLKTNIQYNSYLEETVMQIGRERGDCKESIKEGGMIRRKAFDSTLSRSILKVEATHTLVLYSTRGG